CFFFQAEDGIRDLTVTGVQTCALPISASGEPWLRRFDVATFSHPRYIEIEAPEIESYAERAAPIEPPGVEPWATGVLRILFTREIGRASCRERGWLRVVAGGVGIRIYR